MPQLTLLGKFVIALAVLVVGFGAGWTSNGWRLGTKIAELNNQHLQTIADANELTRIAQRDANLQRDKLAQTQSTIETKYAGQLKEAKNETQHLRDCVANGTCGLRVHATCPARARPVPSPNASSVVDPGPGPELDADARSAYFALRDGIATITKQLGACQETLTARDAAATNMSPAVYSLPTGGKLPKP